MSYSSYVNLFHEDADREDLYEIVDDFLTSNEFVHWQKKYIDEKNIEAATKLKLNYKILYTPSTYNLNYIVKEYLDNVYVLRTLRGLKTELTPEENDRFKYFLKMNNWVNFFKTAIKNYKTYGDVFITFTLKNTQYGLLPMLKILDAKHTEVARNIKTREKEYIYKMKKITPIRNEQTLEIEDKEEEVNLLIRKGEIIPFINGVADLKNKVILPKELSEITPMIHLQFLKKQDCEYSEIPALGFIDTILRLCRVETNISETNDKSGSPTLFVLNGDIAPESTFGARSIVYVDSTNTAMMNGQKAEITQIEIMKGLDTLFKEKDYLIDALFSSANLISPDLKASMAKSDSSKVVKFLSLDLIQELRGAYDSFCEQISPLFKIIFPNRKEEDITFSIPIDFGASTMLDKAAYINSNILSMREMLKEQGRTEEEIDKYMEDMNQQMMMLQGKGITASPIPIEDRETKPDGTTVEKRPEKITETPDGIDNREKIVKK